METMEGVSGCIRPADWFPLELPASSPALESKASLGSFLRLLSTSQPWPWAPLPGRVTRGGSDGLSPRTQGPAQHWGRAWSWQLSLTPDRQLLRSGSSGLNGVWVQPGSHPPGHGIIGVPETSPFLLPGLSLPIWKLRKSSCSMHSCSTEEEREREALATPALLDM